MLPLIDLHNVCNTLRDISAVISYAPGCTHTVLKSIDSMFGGPPHPLPPTAYLTTMSRVFCDMQVIGGVPSGALNDVPITSRAARHTGFRTPHPGAGRSEPPRGAKKSSPVGRMMDRPRFVPTSKCSRAKRRHRYASWRYGTNMTWRLRKPSLQRAARCSMPGCLVPLPAMADAMSASPRHSMARRLCVLAMYLRAGCDAFPAEVVWFPQKQSL